MSKTVRPDHPRFPWLRLLLVLALGLLYWRSYRKPDLVAIFARGGKLQLIGSDRGRLTFWFSNLELGKRRAWTWEHTVLDEASLKSARQLVYETLPLPVGGWGFYIGRTDADVMGLPGVRYHYAIFPDWVLAGPATLWTLVGLRRWIIYHRRRRGGLCLNCGYDVRQSPGRCPECGVVPASVSVRAT